MYAALPSLAVASGAQLYIYRYMRPYMKFALPPVELSTGEQEVWRAVKQGVVDQEAACERLLALRWASW